MKKQLILSLVVVTLLNGCQKLWPTYQQPQVSIPQTWRSSDPETVLTQWLVSDMAWWTHFHNAELNDFIKNALDNNSILQMSYGVILEARAQLQKVQLSWLPQIGAASTGVRGEFYNASITNPIVTPILQKGASYNIPAIDNIVDPLLREHHWPYYGYINGFTASYTLNFFEKYNNTKKKQLDLESKIQTMHSIRLSIISQVVASYFNLLSFHQQEKELKDLLCNLEQQKKLTELQYRHGATSEINLDHMEQEIAYVKRNLPIIQKNIVVTENALNKLMARPPQPITLTHSLDDVSIHHIVPINLPTSLIKQRPDVASAEYQLRSTNKAIAQASSLLLPTMDISAFWGNGALYFANLFTLTTNLIQGQLGVLVPLFDGTIISAISQAKSANYIAFYNYIYALHTALNDVDSALSKKKFSFRSYCQVNKALKKAYRQAQLGQMQYETGAISYLDLLNYQENVDILKIHASQYKQQYLNSVVGLYQALGSGSQLEMCSNPTYKPDPNTVPKFILQN